MKKNFIIKTKLNSIKIAQFLIKLNKIFRIIILDGEMGSGKTFLCYHISRILFGNTNFNFSSPSYNIINIYQKKDLLIYHIDLYRLGNKNQINELGISEILEEKKYDLILIEWPQLILDILRPYNIVNVNLELIDTNLRKCQIHYNQKDL